MPYVIELGIEVELVDHRLGQVGEERVRAGQLGGSQFLKIREIDLLAATIAKSRSPSLGLAKELRAAARYEDMPGVAAVHHTLSGVNTASGDVLLVVHVRFTRNGAAVNSHAELEKWMALSDPGDL